MKNYANSIAYEKYLEQYNYIFQKTYFIKQTIHSLTEDIKLIIDIYNHAYDITHNYGKSISCQRITLQDKTANEIFTAKYAFGRLFHQYIKHSNNNEYFIAGNDLMEFSIYNITKKEEYKFVSECRIDEESDEDCNNEFWYIKEWIYNSSNNLVAINGQDFMNCATITVCDFTNPEILPLKFKNLHKVLADQYGDETCNAIRWTDRNCLELGVGEENVRTVSLTEQEIVKILRTE